MRAHKVTITLEDESGAAVFTETIGMDGYLSMPMGEASEVYEVAFQAARELHDKILNRK